jgi:cell division protein FtsW (lipid II flippase)
MYIDKRRLYHLDWYLICNGLALIAVGLFNLISAARSMDSGPYSLLTKQVFAFGIGVVGVALIVSYDYRVIAGYSKYFYGITLFMIIVVLILGTIAGGAKRWLNIAGVAFQPSELMKPVMIMLLSSMLHQEKRENEPLG